MIVKKKKKKKITKKEEASGLLSSLGIKIHLTKIPLVGIKKFIHDINWMNKFLLIEHQFIP